ncbi:anti-sigma factor family protein [Paenibacillus hamazuiensis]|uniref:anti-sigma factor family protein n=1 Tax=Paenibacillus hamazuiensis TaxID=2936508 RepID=UPI00200CEAE5|nr:hypothetical protein [Paenibacillus hamazuiensis]
MWMKHLNDLQLQRFQNSRCTPQEATRIRKHLRRCDVCRRELMAYAELNRALAAQPLMAAPAHTAERVMAALRSNPASSSAAPRPRLKLGVELANGCVAAAATYLFISTGVWSKIVSIDAVKLGADVHIRTLELVKIVETWARLI